MKEKLDAELGAANVIREKLEAEVEDRNAKVARLQRNYEDTSNSSLGEKIRFIHVLCQMEEDKDKWQQAVAKREEELVQELARKDNLIAQMKAMWHQELKDAVAQTTPLQAQAEEERENREKEMFSAKLHPVQCGMRGECFFGSVADQLFGDAGERWVFTWFSFLSFFIFQFAFDS